MTAGKIISDEPKPIVILRAWLVPILSTIVGSTISLLPLAGSLPGFASFGFLMLLGWRLLRPEFWPVWIGLPLGLIDDLLSGAPIGTAMCLWTVTLLVLEILDAYLLWRDYWIDWLIATIAIATVTTLGFWLDGHSALISWPMIAAPQIIMSALCFPLLLRLCSRLDRLRLPG